MGRCRRNLALFTTILASWVGATGSTAFGEERSERTLERDEGKVSAELEAGEAIELDSLSEPVTAGIDLTPFTCEEVAPDANDRVSSSNRFRGNTYHFNSPGLLHYFAIELDFTGQTDLYFSVLRRTGLAGTFTRVVPDTLVTVTGDGRRFYGTPDSMPPVQLLGGGEYILGVAWGSRSITRIRDSIQYPQDFSHGRTLGNGSIDLIPFQGSGPPLNIPPTGVFMATSTSGALGMNLCFQPEPGACCCVGPDIEGQSPCLQRLKTECVNLGGFFRGERQPCSICRCGACCKPCRAECENDVEQLECTSELVRGDWKGMGSQCSDENVSCPVLTGACCTGTTCRELCSFECEAIPNSLFSGIGTDCSPNYCGGACCLDGTPGGPGACLDRTEAFCLDSVSGTYKGDGSSCATLGQPILDPPNPPVPTTQCGGACCWGFLTQDRCDEVPSRLDCTEESLPNARYLGDGARCPTNCLNPVRTYGACCLADSVCIMTTSVFCDASWIGGVYRGDNVPCSPTACLNIPTGACCIPNGDCLLGIPEPDCVASGGEYQGDGSICTPPCEQPIGACCIDGECQEQVTSEFCEVNDGVFHGIGSVCQLNNPCPGPVGACCFEAEDNCRQLTQSSCMDQSGMFRGVGVSCAICPEAPGACCRSDGTCAFVTRTVCDGQAGIFIGVGQECIAGQCEAPQSCCFTDGLCEDLVQMACVTQGGTPQGVNTDCSQELCPPPPTGACCYQDGSPCVANLSGRECEDTGGIYGGNDVACSACPAPLVGACCLPEFTCIETTQFECEGPSGGDYQGHNSQCETPGICPPPPPTGACCLGDGRCLERTSSQCQQLGGVFEGDNTDCTPNPCDPPPNDLCTDSIGPLEISSTTLGTTENTIVNNDADAGTCAAVVISPGARGVWYTVMGNGRTLTASLCDTVSTFDTKISVYCRDCADPLCVFANDDVCGVDGLQSSVSWCSEAGIVYRILVHGFQTNNGPFELDITSNETACTPTVNCIPLGACCFENEPCRNLRRLNCEAAGGSYSGDDTDCSIPPGCPAFGPCCLSNATCTILTDATCIAQNGDPLPDQFPTCLNAPCEPVPTGACCLGGEVCRDLTRQSCMNQGGNYLGALSACLADLCPSACCFASDGRCEILFPGICTSQGGVPQPGPICVPHLCAGPNTGACCLESGVCLQNRTMEECEAEQGNFRGVGSVCSEDFCPLPVRGACCLVSGECLDAFTMSECSAAGGTFQGADVACIDVNCPLAEGACCEVTGCGVTTRAVCLLIGQFRGEGTDCVPNPCLSIIESDPPSNAIDARQPHLINNAAIAQGIMTITLTFDGDTAGMTSNDFTVSTLPVGAGPSVVDVMTSVDMATLTFSGPLPPERWSEIIYVPSGSSTCLGFLPGDVRGDRGVDSDDAVRLHECLDGTVFCELIESDLDRSNAVNGLDLIRFADLFLGADAFIEWGSTTSPHILAVSPCDEPMGACCMGTTCELMTGDDCVSGGGVYRGDGEECTQPGPCISIIESRPPANTIDARQPHLIDDANALQGIMVVNLRFDGSDGGFAPTHFSVESTPTGPTPMVVSTPYSEFVAVHFDRPIPPGNWTKLTYLPSGSEVCVGFLPGDFDGSGTVDDQDVTAMMGCFMAPAVPCDPFLADIDWSGFVDVFDLVRLLDLLNGASAFEVWNGATLGQSPCTP